MSETKIITGSEAIEAWNKSRSESDAIKLWSMSPNGGRGGPMGCTTWASDDYVVDLLREIVEYDIDLEYNPDSRTLTICHYPDRDVHQIYSLSWQPEPSQGKRKIAYFGIHAGFSWEDDFKSSEALQKLLENLYGSDESLQKFGLTTCEDYLYGDDGLFWLVADAERFTFLESKCRKLDEDWDDQMSGEEVAEYILKKD